MVKLTSHGPWAFVNSIKLGVDGSKNKKTIRNLFSFLSVVNLWSGRGGEELPKVPSNLTTFHVDFSSTTIRLGSRLKNTLA